MATKARQQYHADEVTLSKDRREFSISDAVQEKIEGIEEGAQVNTIETIRVNGNEVQPDENKAIDLTIPGVVDSLDSTSSIDALSARQGKVLYDYIQDVSHIGHFLALWDASTGLPVTDPETSPYIYNTGDFYTVSVVAPEGGTNYKPDGTQYVIGQASTAVDTDDVAVNDFYFYDGTTWRHMKNSGAGSIAIDGSLSTTSTNPVENRVITNALNGKADATDINTKTFYINGTTGATNIAVAQEAYDWYLAGKNPIISYLNSKFTLNSADSGSVEFLGPTVQGDGPYAGGTEVGERILRFILSNGQVTSISDRGLNNSINYISIMDPQDNAFIPTYDWQPASKKYVDDNAGKTYTAGANIQISNEDVISATDTKYTAGTGISIDANNVISNTQPGPVVSATAPSNPSEGDLWYDTTNDVLKTYDGTNWIAVGVESNTKTFYLSNTSDLTNAQAAYDWFVAGKNPIIMYHNMAYIIYSSSASRIYFASSFISNATAGNSVTQIKKNWISFSLSSGTVTAININNDYGLNNYLDTSTNYTTPYTPLYDGSPATKKYVDDTASSSASGKVSDTAYASSWNGVTGVAPSKNAVYDKISAMDTTIAGKQATLSAGTGISLTNNTVTNTGVTSVNGNTGAVTIDEPNTKTFYLSSTSDTTNAQAALDWYLAGKNPIIVYNDTSYITYNDLTSGTLTFRSLSSSRGNVEGYSYRTVEELTIRFNSSNVVTTITWGNTNFSGSYIATDFNYPTPYTPQYPGSPATKKYVDDNSFSATNGGVKIFDMPSVNGDMSAIIEWLTGGGDVILRTISSNVETYYTVIEWDGTNRTIKAENSDGNAVVVYTVTYSSAGVCTAVTNQSYSGGEVNVSTQANNILTSGMKIWAGTQANYEALGTYDNNTVYLTIE